LLIKSSIPLSLACNGIPEVQETNFEAPNTLWPQPLRLVN
jgi:hypothetical protein